MTNATIVTSTMSDNSKSYEVAFANDQGHKIATLAAEDRKHAKKIADAINNASWIQFHSRG
jgi:hypothetical protein